MSIAIQRPTTVILSQQESLLPILEATASNLANSDTSGFKRLLSPTQEVVRASPKSDNISYVSLPTPRRDFDQGSLKQTRETFDLALSGKGFFMISDNRYTRSGHFTLDAEGKLVTATGQALLDSGGSAITIPNNARSVNISEDGIISDGSKILGQVGVVTFADSQQLQSVGNGLFTSTEEGDAATETRVLQGYIEESNVGAAIELTTLIEINRLFEQGQKMLDEEMKRRSKEINASSRNS